MQHRSKKLNLLNLAEKQENPVYWQLMEHLHQNKDISVGELAGSKGEEFAFIIKRGGWLDLDFSDEEFVRHIFKALRLNLITIEQMTTALFLHEITSQLNISSRDINQYPFLAADHSQYGPYSIHKISYISGKNIADFYRELNHLPESERYYFAINLPRQLEVAFLLDGLLDFDASSFNGKFFRCYPSYEEFFKKYIYRSDFYRSGYPGIQKSKVITLVEKLKDPSDWEVARHELARFIYSQESSLSSYLAAEPRQLKDSQQAKLREDSHLLVDLLRTNEQLPALTISPAYNSQDPNSPLIALIIPTFAAGNLLQKIVHGEHATLPFFMVGEANKMLFRELDEKPELFKSEFSLRPVELNHPDFTPTTIRKGMIPHSWLRIWHDLFMCWRHGANKQKLFLRYLRMVLETVKGFSMSKKIFALCDINSPGGRKYRELEKKYQQPILERYHFYFILQQAGIDFWSRLDKHDHNLIFMIDMILNPDIWTGYLGISPQHLFTTEKFREFNTESEDFAKMMTEFQQVYQTLKGIIKRFPMAAEEGIKKASLFYVLAYRLKDSPSFLEQLYYLYQKDLLRHVSWAPDGGMLVKYENKPREIEALLTHELYAAIAENDRVAFDFFKAAVQTEGAHQSVLLKVMQP